MLLGAAAALFFAIIVTIFFDSIGLIYESPQELFTDLLANGFAIFAIRLQKPHETQRILQIPPPE